MENYLATFYTHYGAMTFYKLLTQQGIKARLMPVPRKLSASCGVCVRFCHTSPDFEPEDLEELFLENNGVYEKIRAT